MGTIPSSKVASVAPARDLRCRTVAKSAQRYALVPQCPEPVTIKPHRFLELGMLLRLLVEPSVCVDPSLESLLDLSKNRFPLFPASAAAVLFRKLAGIAVCPFAHRLAAGDS